MSDSSPAATASQGACTFAVLVDGARLSARFHVLSLHVEKELNRIPSARLEVRDGDPAAATFEASNTDLFIPGKKIEIQLGYGSNNQPVFKGIVVKHSIRIRKNHSVLLVECRDLAVRMTRHANSRHFAAKKDSQIIEEIIAAHRLKYAVEATSVVLGEVVQYDASDWDFVACRAEANGQVVLAEDGEVKVRRPALDQEPAASVKYGSTLLELDAEIDARWQSEGIRATSWRAADQLPAVADAAEPRATRSGNLDAAALAAVLGGGPQLIRHGAALGDSELQAWADAHLLRERLSKVRGRARCQGFAAARPGCIVAVSGIGQRFEGRMYVSGVRHTVANGNWETDLQLGLNPQQFAATYALRPPAAAGLLPAVRGLQTGVVTALQGDPAHEERIAVRLPFVSNSNEGVWARIAALDAGKGRGAFFRPDIGDEVVVGFLDSDPRHPVVLGMCHSSAKPAPEAAADANHHKGYVSRTRLRWLFDDDKKSIVLETAAGNRLSLSEEAQGIALADQNGNKITLDSSGIRIESSKGLVLKAATDIKLEGANVDLKAGASFKAAAAGSAELSGANTKVDASATVVIRGGQVHIN